MPSGQYWSYRAYADLTGTQVPTTGSGSTAVSAAVTAAVDGTKHQLAALIGDSNGFLGQANCPSADSRRIRGWSPERPRTSRSTGSPNVASLNSPETVYSGNVAVSDNAITVPVTSATPTAPTSCSSPRRARSRRTSRLMTP